MATRSQPPAGSIRVADSITKLGPEYRGTVLVAGSHGGRYCGYLAAAAGLCGVILNDAGGGKDAAGVGSLVYLEALGVPAAVVGHRSARIGDGRDMLQRGRLSAFNAPARGLGCREGDTCQDTAERFAACPAFAGRVPPYAEARATLRGESPALVLCDSASLIVAEDAGAVLVTGSHGGILAGRPDYGIAAAARAAVFNDAGVGVDEAGIGRLPVLERHGIAGVTVDAMSARIGDARSAWETGVLSFVNPGAARAGAEPGMSVQAFAALFA